MTMSSHRYSRVMAGRGRSREQHAIQPSSEVPPLRNHLTPETSARASGPVGETDIHALDDLLATLLDKRHAGLRITALATMVARADAPSVFRVDDANGRPCAVVLCSPHAAPDIVLQGIERARTAKQALLAAEARHVLDPLAEGRLDGLSYAVMPYCNGLRRIASPGRCSAAGSGRPCSTGSGGSMPRPCAPRIPTSRRRASRRPWRAWPHRRPSARPCAPRHCGPRAVCARAAGA
jgi:hypothetical protein